MFNLIFASFALLIAELTDAQTPKPPLNTAANVGDRVTIECTTNSSTLPQWRYSLLDNSMPIPISSPGVCSSLIPERFEVQSTGPGNCNLIIPNATTAEALAYECTNSLYFVRSMLLTIIESVEVYPFSSIEEPCQGDQLDVTCTVKYAAVSSATLQMFPSIMWTNLSGNANISGTTPSPMPPNVTTSYLSITATPPTVPPYKCNVYFNAPTFPPTGFATNAPNYYKSTNTTELKVQYLNDSAFITSNITSPCVNETAFLECEANGYPMPSYMWRNADTNESISNTKDVIIYSGGNYVCFVNSSACNSTTTLQISCNSDTRCATCSPAIVSVITSVGNTATGRLDLTCNASGLPAPMYEWTTSAGKIGDDNELPVSANGNYTCTAYNFIHGVRHTDNYTISITGIIVPDDTEDDAIIIIIISVVCGWIAANLIVSGISFVIYRKHKVIMNGKISWLKKMMPCANSKDENVDDPLCKKIFWVSLCVLTSVFVAVIVYPILFAIAGCPCCRKSHQGSRYADNSHNSDAKDNPGPSHYEELERNQRTIQVYEGLSQRHEYGKATGNNGCGGSFTLELNSQQQIQSPYEELQRNQRQPMPNYQELIR